MGRITDKVNKLLIRIANRLGIKKDNLLEAGKEDKRAMESMNIEVEENDTNIEKSAPINDFREELKFDPNNILDPRVCKGKNLVPNILKSLGANEQILENPVAIKNIEEVFNKIIEKNNIELKNGEPSKEQIDRIREIISKGKFTERDPENQQSAILIDSETGFITLKDNYKVKEGPLQKHTANNADTIEYSISDDGVLKSDRKTYSRSLQGNDSIYTDVEQTFNKDGFELSRKVSSLDWLDYYKKESEEKNNAELVYKYERDKENPLIARCSSAEKGQRFIVMSTSKGLFNNVIKSFGFHDIYDARDGKLESVETVTDGAKLEMAEFETKEEAEEYYKVNEAKFKERLSKDKSVNNADILKNILDERENELEQE